MSLIDNLNAINKNSQRAADAAIHHEPAVLPEALPDTGASPVSGYRGVSDEPGEYLHSAERGLHDPGDLDADLRLAGHNEAAQPKRWALPDADIAGDAPPARARVASGPRTSSGIKGGI